MLGLISAFQIRQNLALFDRNTTEFEPGKNLHPRNNLQEVRNENCVEPEFICVEVSAPAFQISAEKGDNLKPSCLTFAMCADSAHLHAHLRYD